MENFDNNLFDIPQELIQKIVCKQMLSPIDEKNRMFVQEFFKPRYFKNEYLKDLYELFVKFHEKFNKTMSKDLLFKILQNDTYKEKSTKYTPLINDIYAINEEAYSTEFISDLLVKHTRECACYYALLDSVDDIQKKQDIYNCFKRVEACTKIMMDSGELGVEYFSNIDNHIKDLLNKEERTPFKYNLWDYYTYGGIPAHDACLFIIMAQPGLGKSQCMMNIGANWIYQNKNVLMITLEMSEKMYSQRMDAIFSEINVNELKDNTDKLKKQVDLVHLNNPHARLQIKQYSPNEFNSNKLKMLLQKLYQTKNFKPDLIIVDYLNLMSTNVPAARMNTYERVGTISKELRSVSIQTHIPILSATQANRCLAGNTQVETIDGIKLIKNIKENDLVKSNEGFNKVLKVYKEKQKVFKIKLKSGKQIICSKNHIFPSSQGELSIQTGLHPGIKLFSI